MDKLEKEEVLHVAELARIEISDEELARYQISLKKLFDEIDKITNVDINDDILLTPSSATTQYSASDDVYMQEANQLLKNANKTSGNYIEVPVVINE